MREIEQNSKHRGCDKFAVHSFERRNLLSELLPGYMYGRFVRYTERVSLYRDQQYVDISRYI